MSAADPSPRSVPFALLGVGVILLVLGATVSGLMAAAHLQGLELPGCGPGGGCAKAAASVWGKVPIVKWPTSYVGVAYFLGILGAWLVAAGNLASLQRWIVRIGVLMSILLAVVMFAEGYVCGYCLTVHGLNIAFLVVMTLAGRGLDPPPARGAATPWIALAGVFVAATLMIWVVDASRRATIEERERGELERSTDEIVRGTNDDNDTPDPDQPPFTGRHRLGPEVAKIRVVVFGDYQCADCKGIESELMAIQQQRDDMSFAFKHFPFCTDCNKWMPENMHPNACWAARAAETAALIGGEDGFWDIHHWLFDQGGGFTRDELKAYTDAQGYDFDEWSSTMMGDASLQPILVEIDEAMELGLRQTPMIFINGVELEGWRVQGAIPRAIAAVVASDPPARGPDADRPMTSLDKAMTKWRNRAPLTLPPDRRAWPIGNPTGPITVTIWGDYQEPYTAFVDGLVRRWMADRNDVRYVFRHYPINQECNPQTGTTKHPMACLAAKAAEAAGSLGGPAGYAGMHAWILGNQSNLSEQTLVTAAVQMGLDRDAFITAMQSPDAANAIVEDATAGKSTGLRSVPHVFVNDKLIEAWKFGNKEALTPILDAAAGE